MKSIFQKLFFSVAIVALAFLLSGCGLNETEQTNDTTPSATTNQENQDEPVTLTVIDNTGEETVYEAPFSENETVYELIQRVDKRETGLEFQLAEFDLGDGTPAYYVEGVNGLVGEGEREFWLFLVDDEVSSVGISDFILSPRSKVTFQYSVTK